LTSWSLSRMHQEGRDNTKTADNPMHLKTREPSRLRPCRIVTNHRLGECVGIGGRQATTRTASTCITISCITRMASTSTCTCITTTTRRNKRDSDPPGPKGEASRPGGSPTENRTSRPELDRDDAQKTDRCARHHFVTMSMLRHACWQRLAAQEFMTQ
jgi:hypothetical protein